MTIADPPPPTDADPGAPRGDVPDVEVPHTADDFAKAINKGVARALTLATTSKELTDAIKVATDWYKVRFAAEDEDLGAAFGSKTRGAA